MTNTVKNKPLVSVIMPLYNSESYVGDSILSVINQTYNNWELIICDDCSTDKSYTIASEYSNKDNRIIVVKNDVNSGTAVARNNALNIAKGSYIAFLDSDDLYDPTFMEKQIGFISDKQFVFCSFRRKADNSITNYIVPKTATYKRILKGSCLTPLSVFISRELIGDIRFLPESKVEDFVFFLDLLKKCKFAYGNPEVLATYRIVPNSKSRNKKALVKKMWQVYHHELKFNIFTSLFYLFYWAIHGLYKYRNVK